MGESRIETAMARIEAALERIQTARPQFPDTDTAVPAGADAPMSADADVAGGPSRVLALVNAHEKLREEVAETLRDLDALIEDLEQ